MPLLIVADTHINGTTSLCPEVIKVDDGNDIYPNSFQLQLRAAWLEQIEKVKSRLYRGRFQGAKELTVVFNGDLADMDAKGRTNQIISRNEADVLRMMTDTLKPVIEIASKKYCIRGTGVHDGLSSVMVELFAEDIKAEKDPSRGTFSWWHLRKIFDNRRWDITHHIKGGTKACVYNLAEALYKHCGRRKDEEGRSELMPHFVARSHVHHIYDTGQSYNPLRVFTTPCFGFPAEFAYRIGAENDYPDIGMVYWDGGDADPEFLRMPIKPRGWEIG